jgi:hypothetical protein
MSGLAIIIDTWGQLPTEQRHHQIPDQCAANIVDFCKHNTDISAVALASYSIDPNFDAYFDASWIENSKIFFQDETKWDFLRKSWQRIQWNHDDHTHKTIRTMDLRSDQIKFFAISDIQILYYCLHINPSIKNIYFFGSAWDICIKFRPVGWLQLAALSYHNLLPQDIQFKTHRSCVHSITEYNLDIGSPWVSTEQHEIFTLDKDQIKW